MHAAEVVTGRRFALVLEPGEELLGSIAAFCAEHGVSQAIVPLVFGAFRSMRFIGADAPPADDEVPLPESVEVAYVEGSGGGSIAPRVDGGVRVHVHAAVGTKSASAAATAGHVLHAIVHYTVEVVIDEVIEPGFRLESVEASHGLECLRFGD